MILRATKLLPLCLTALVAACVGGAVAVPPQPLATALQNTNWKLASYDGEAVPSLITMRFGADGSVSGLVICNSFSSTARFSERAIELSNVTQTLLGCELSGNLAAQATVRKLLAQETVPAKVSSAGLELRVGRHRLLLVPQE